MEEPDEMQLPSLNNVTDGEVRGFDFLLSKVRASAGKSMVFSEIQDRPQIRREV